MSYILCSFWIFMLPVVNKPVVNINRSTELQICAREDLLSAASKTLRPIQPTHNLHHLPPVYFGHIYVWPSVNPPVRRGRLRRKSVGINICAGYIVFAFRDVHVWTDKNMSVFTLEAFTAGTQCCLWEAGRSSAGTAATYRTYFRSICLERCHGEIRGRATGISSAAPPPPPSGAGGGRVWVTLRHFFFWFCVWFVPEPSPSPVLCLLGLLPSFVQHRPPQTAH